MQRVGVVGAAIVRDYRLLASRRTEPPSMAGRWEFAGGKVEDGESDEQALVREIREELELEVTVGERVGGDVLIGDSAVLRVYLCTAAGEAEPALVDHDAHRWLAGDELGQVAWLTVDLPIVEAMRDQLLRRPILLPSQTSGS